MLQRIATFLEMIKFSHSVFALPFALAGMLVAGRGWPPLGTLFWIVVAVVAARTAAMVFNRIADRDVDAGNPRTANRALVTGELSMGFAIGALVVAAGVFYFAAWRLNPLCGTLAPICLAVLLGYSVTKRFTAYSHLFLGAALGLAPVGAWIAVTGSFALAPLLLGAAVLFWVGGFDVLYACQDVDFDREQEGLHSLPKRIGVPAALRRARLWHAVSALLLLAFWFVASPPLGVPTLLGIGIVAAILNYEHSLVRPGDLSRINAAFFTANGIISVGLFLLIWLDL